MPRKPSTFFAALLAAVLIGLREGTGLAPPPPLIVEEEIHWLAPDSDDDPGLDFWFEDAPTIEEPDGTASPQPPAVKKGLFRAAWTALRGRRDRGSGAGWGQFPVLCQSGA